MAASDSSKVDLQSARESFVYFHQITTRWKDIDLYGHVNNTVYYSFIDTTVNEHLVKNAVLEPESGAIIGLVVESFCSFMAPLSHPDVIECGLRVTHLGTSSVRYEVGMFSAGCDDAAAVGYQVHVFVDRVTRRPAPLPDKLRRVMRNLMIDEA